MNSILDALLELAHEIGREDRPLAILNQGQVSARLTPEQFATKGAGAVLGTLAREELAVCHSAKLLALLEHKNLPDEEIERALLECRRENAGPRPPGEAMLQAWLLSLEGVNFVAQCQPAAAIQILGSPRARDFAEKRISPDEVVCCGPASVLAPYVDGGLGQAREIRDRTLEFIEKQGGPPRLILLQNQGLVALGGRPETVLNALLMAAKAAEIFVGAAALGGPNFLTPQQVKRIAAHGGEPFRQPAPKT